MSVHVSSWVWRQRVGNAGEKMVLLKLADMSDDFGWSWPSQKRLAEECELSRRTLQRKLYALRDKGLIEIHEEGAPNVKAKTCGYRVVRHSDARAESAPASPVTPLPASPVTHESSVEPSGPSLRSGARPADLIWDTLAELLGDPPRTKAERARWNKAAKELREADVTPEEIRAAVDAYGRHPTFKDCALTPLAIVTNLSTLLTWARPAEASRAADIRRRMAERGIA